MGLFISFEGGEGTGKSTQAELLAERLQDAGYSVLAVREPGTTRLGTLIRDLLKRGFVAEEKISSRAELLLFAAARAELVTNVIRPALGQQETVVVADRYLDSTTAYQGYGRGIPLVYVSGINELATDGVVPNLTLLLDCSPEEGLRRVGALQLRMPLDGPQAPRSGHHRDEEGTRFEEESLEFHKRVRKGYLKLVEEEPERWRVIDATKPIGEINDLIMGHVREKLHSAGHPGKGNLAL